MIRRLGLQSTGNVGIIRLGQWVWAMQSCDVMKLDRKSHFGSVGWERVGVDHNVLCSRVWMHQQGRQQNAPDALSPESSNIFDISWISNIPLYLLVWLNKCVHLYVCVSHTRAHILRIWASTQCSLVVAGKMTLPQVKFHGTRARRHPTCLIHTFQTSRKKNLKWFLTDLYEQCKDQKLLVVEGKR